MNDAGFQVRADGPTMARVSQAGGSSIYTVLYAYFDRLSDSEQQRLIDDLQRRKNAQQFQRMKGTSA